MIWELWSARGIRDSELPYGTTVPKVPLLRCKTNEKGGKTLTSFKYISMLLKIYHGDSFPMKKVLAERNRHKDTQDAEIPGTETLVSENFSIITCAGHPYAIFWPLSTQEAHQ